MAKEVVSKSADAARKAATTPAPSAFATYTDMIGTNRYSNPADETTKLYMNFLEGTGSAKNLAFQQLYRGLVNQPSPSGKGTMFDYVQTLMRSTKISSGGSPIGVPSASDVTGLEKVIGMTIGSNAPDLVSYLQAISSGGTGAQKIAQQDTTTQYNKQISTALQLKDAGDAKQALHDAYFAAWGQAPSADLITKFENAWNLEAKNQVATSTTDTTVSFEPVLDKNGKQKVNKSGQLQYKPITKMVSKSTGEGFTQAEQQQFLANYLVANNPNATWDTTKLGGAAKTIYDDLIQFSNNNYSTIPTLEQLGPIITQVLGTTDGAVSQEVLKKYKDSIRMQTGSKYMGLQQYLAAGEDASKYVNPLIDTMSQFLESPITMDDPLMKLALNYQGPDKQYRLMNDYELTQTMMKDPRYLKTSKAKNEAVNMAQVLKNELGR